MSTAANGKISPPQIQNLEEIQNFESGKLLERILDLTLGEILVVNDDDKKKKKKVVNFKHPNELQKILAVSLDSNGCQSIEKIEDILQKVIEHSVKTSHPHFFNQLFGGVDEVSLSGAWLLEALNTNIYTFEVAPVFVLLEHYMIQELCRIFNWDDGDGIFSPGGSISNMYSIALARHYRYPETKENGLFGKKELVIFTSDMSHYSIGKGAAFMGFGTNQVVQVPTDENGHMRASALRKALHKVKEEGREPFFVNSTSGTTVLGAFDPLEEIGKVCDEEGLWMHVDACWGGAVILSDKHRHLLNGVERADSISWNPHKMICAPLQCSVLLVKHKGLLAECNRGSASYLFQQDKFYDISYDTGDKSIQCGRKADAFKLWFMFKVHGLNVFKNRVDHAFEAASYLETEIERRSGFRLVLDQRECTNVCFWYVPPSLRGQEETKEWWMKIHKVAPLIKSRMVKKGSLLVGYQPLEPKRLVNFFRMVLTGFPVSGKEEMDFVLDEIERLGEDIL